MSANYEEILKGSWDNIPEIVTLPNGTWRLKCRGAKVAPARGEDKSPQIVFVYEPQEPMQDVDDEALAALGDKYNFTENRIFHRMWAGSNKDLNAVAQHLALHGINAREFESIPKSLEAVKNTDILGYVVTRTYQSKKTGKQEQENEVKYFTAE